MEALKLFTSGTGGGYFDIPLPDMTGHDSAEASPSPVTSPAVQDTTDDARDVARGPCHKCGKQTTPRTGLASTSPTSPHSGRVYFPCTNARCSKGRSKLMNRSFVAWDTHGEPPRCDCGLPAKQVRMGREDVMPGYGVWKCAHGECRYASRDRKGRSVENGEVRGRDVQSFIPWMVHGQ